MLFAVRITAATAAVALTAAVAGCSGGGEQGVDSGPGWVNRTVYAASTIDVGAGVAAVTVLRQDRKLHTAALSLQDGEELWGEPATMVGRLSGLGVQPPAVVETADGDGIVVAVEPLEDGQQGNNADKRATLVARDAATGAEEWTRPVHSTFGPTACGTYVCLSEDTSRDSAQFVALDPRTGKAIWKTPGVAEVQHAGENAVVMLTLGDNPKLESRQLRTGRVRWELPLSQAVGGAVSLSGGWDFTQVGDSLVGYLGPYRQSAQESVPGYGFFAVDVGSGQVQWKQRRVVRLHPSPKPSALLLTRKVGQNGQGYGAFVRLDPDTGQADSQIPPKQVPKFEWWLGFSSDLDTLGFISGDRAGAAVDLSSGEPVEVDGQTVWSYCTRNPQPLPLTEHEGFYATAALCEFDLSTGEKVQSDGPPPTWVTGATDGWRVWRDESGAVHGADDGDGTTPGMYG